MPHIDHQQVPPGCSSLKSLPISRGCVSYSGGGASYLNYLKASASKPINLTVQIAVEEKKGGLYQKAEGRAWPQSSLKAKGLWRKRDRAGEMSHPEQQLPPCEVLVSHSRVEAKAKCQANSQQASVFKSDQI